MFTVSKSQPIVAQCNHGIVNSPAHVLTYRTDTMEPLGVVSNGYEILQPDEAYDLVAATTGSNNVTTKWDGKKMIIQAPINRALLPGDDEVVTNFAVINSFDGTSSIYGLGISFRLFCQNQLNTAFRQSKANGTSNRIRHNGDFDYKLSQFKEACAAIGNGQRDFMKDVHTLVSTKVTQAKIEELWKKVVPHIMTFGNKDNQNEAKISSFIQYATRTYEAEREMGAPDSLWLAANAVTKYIQHNVAGRGRKPDMDRRFVDCAIGGRAMTSAKVMRAALEMV